MRFLPRAAFSLLENVVALALFAGVLLGVLATGQFIIARLHDSDLRFRAAAYAQAIADSLRGSACTRLASGTGAQGPLAAAWSVAGGLDVAHVSIAIAVPQRAGPPRSQLTAALVSCPEP